MIDTHCHLTYKPLHQQLSEVLARAAGAGIDQMICVGTSPDDARLAAALAREHEPIYATVGIHPHYAHQWTDKVFITEAVQQLTLMPKVIALGEMGLDYYYPDPPRADQRRAFEWQLNLAADLVIQKPLPLIIHNRQATHDVIDMIKASGIPGQKFVFHCFTGTAKELDAVLDLGAMVSFTGIITFKNAVDLATASDHVPANRIMIETDSPYLTPEPHRKIRPNEPCYLSDIAHFLADRRNESIQSFLLTVEANAKIFFGL